jgi:hypothetical protein
MKIKTIIKKNLILIFSFLLLACSPIKTIRFKTDTFKSDGKIVKFKIKVPKNYIAVEQDLFLHLLKSFTYLDKNVLYISIDTNFGYSPNKVNWLKCSDPIKGIKCTNGKSANNTNWKEIIFKDLLIGYYNVSNEKKKEFDDALESLQVIRKTNLR